MNKKPIFLIAAVLCFANGALAKEPVRYLAFQIFTSGVATGEIDKNIPPASAGFQKTVSELADTIGMIAAGDRQLGFVLGPVSFDNSDEDVRQLISDGFKTALETGVAVGFHIDDSMFWGRLKELNTPNNIEWLDWKGAPNTGRRLDWSSTPTKIMPQLCFNSKDVKSAVAKRAALIGNEIAKGLDHLHAVHKDDLFLGVIAGWETQIGRDFETGKSLGYCALTNAGYSESKPPVDLDEARSKIVLEFIDFWARSLIAAGVPRDKVYSHIGFVSSDMYQVAKRTNPSAFSAPYLQAVNFTSPAIAFCDHCHPGFSTYPQPGHLEQWQNELKKHGNPVWASCEGTAIDPAEAEHSGKGMDMEDYLGNLFNHGAVLVNIFGWGVGDSDNPFRKIAENAQSLEAYRKFLHGETLHEAPIAVQDIPSANLADRIHKLQAALPDWIQKNGPAQVKSNMERLDQALKEQRYNEASQIVDVLLKIIDGQKP